MMSTMVDVVHTNEITGKHVVKSVGVELRTTQHNDSNQSIASIVLRIVKLIKPYERMELLDNGVKSDVGHDSGALEEALSRWV
jgi:hypothetical protein